MLLFAVHHLGRKTQFNRDAGPGVNRYVERRTHPARAPTCASDRPAPSREWLEQAQGIGAAYGNASEELIYSCVRAGKRQSTAKKCNHELPRSTTVSARSLLARLTDAIETTDVVENHDRTTILRNYGSQ